MTSGYGRVHEYRPVHTAERNCTRDEGGPFEVGNQVLISSHRKLLWPKNHGGAVSRRRESAMLYER